MFLTYEYKFLGEDFEMTDYLYHYTTISSLALILKNKTLRLNSLEQMDDLQEIKSMDIQNFGKFIYVSAWTDKKEEIIPMWKMYTKPQFGVRIGLPKNPFQIIDSKTNEFRDPTDNEIRIIQNEKNEGIYPIIRMEDMLHKNCIISNISLGQQLIKIDYTMNIEKLEPQVLTIDMNNMSFNANLSKLGCVKNNYWKFQQEWRYIIRAIPFSIINSFENYEAEMMKFQRNIIKGQAEKPFPYIDLQLSVRDLERMQIITAPDMPESNKILVESLVGKYNPKAQIISSKLEGLLK